MLSVSLIIPAMGKWYDVSKEVAISSGLSPELADAAAGSSTFLKVAFMPAVLLVVFIVMYFVRKKSFRLVGVHATTT